jgi:hypothetical protein
MPSAKAMSLIASARSAGTGSGRILDHGVGAIELKPRDRQLAAHGFQLLRQRAQLAQQGRRRG